MSKIRILQLEDSVTDAELICRNLQREGFDIESRRVETKDRYEAEVEAFDPHLILSDYSLPHFDGLSALEFAHENHPDIPFIFVSGTINEDTAIAALRGGATDYVLKTNLKRLVPAVHRALKDVNTRAARIQAETRFRDLIEFSPSAIIVLNEIGKIETINARTEALLGYKRNELIGQSYRILEDGKQNTLSLILQKFHDSYKEKELQGEVMAPLPAFENDVKRKDGSTFSAEISLSPLKIGSALWISGVVTDITERNAQAQRIARLHRIQMVLTHINAAGIRVRERTALCQKNCESLVKYGGFAMAWIGLLEPDSKQGKIIAWSGVNNGYVEQVNLSADPNAPQAQRPANLAMSENRIVVCNDIANDATMVASKDLAVQNGFCSMAALPLVTNGTVIGALALYAHEIDFFNLDEIVLLKQLAADLVFALEHQQSQARLSYLAYYDSLTNLPNRTLFESRLRDSLKLHEATTSSRSVVVLLDVDRFRLINDTFGRDIGDLVLKEVAARLEASSFAPECIARLDSSCFALMFNSTLPEDVLVEQVNSNLAATMTKPAQLAGKDIRISFRAGTAIFPDHGDNAQVLIGNASAALYSAKTSKVPHLLYSAAMNSGVAEQIALESRLKLAIEKQQFSLHYQPKMDLASGHLVGLEALIRWHDPERGMVPPFQFIGMLEETGLILEVGLWVMQEAHRQHREWIQRGLAPPRIGVNVSQLQIRQRNFIDQVLQLVADGPSQALEIEITESLFMEDPSESIEKLVALRQAGVTIAVDDFGTGYSSLSYIAQLPIDALKIDRSFITDIGKSANHMALVSTIIALAHSLNLKVVAEGVETAEQSHLLRLLRCDQVQGYLYSRPLPASDIEVTLQSALNKRLGISPS